MASIFWSFFAPGSSWETLTRISIAKYTTLLSLVRKRMSSMVSSKALEYKNCGWMASIMDWKNDNRVKDTSVTWYIIFIRFSNSSAKPWSSSSLFTTYSDAMRPRSLMLAETMNGWTPNLPDWSRTETRVMWNRWSRSCWMDCWHPRAIFPIQSSTPSHRVAIVSSLRTGNKWSSKTPVLKSSNAKSSQAVNDSMTVQKLFTKLCLCLDNFAFSMTTCGILTSRNGLTSCRRSLYFITIHESSCMAWRMPSDSLQFCNRSATVAWNPRSLRTETISLFSIPDM